MIDFSPAQHARIRLHLALIPAYICLISGWRDLLSRLPIGPGSDAHLPRDFAGIAYLAGRIANLGDAHALYDADRRAAMLAELLPGGPQVRYPPFYGPQISVLFSPFARLPYGQALAAWMVLTLAIYLGCAYLIWRVCPRLRDRAGAIAVLLLADPVLYYTLSFAQISAIALVCVTGGFLALRAKRPFVAGLFLGSLAYKPSFGLAVAFVFLFASMAREASAERRVLIGAVAGAAAQLAVGALFWGPSILKDYARAQLRLIPDMGDEFYLHHLHSWRGFFEILGVSNAAATAGYAIAAVVVLGIALRVWRSDGPLPVRYSVLLIATVLVNPHGYVYDSIILMPAYLLLWNWAEEYRGRTSGDVLPSAPFQWVRKQPFATALSWLLYFCYFAPWFAIVALVLRIQLLVPALTLLACLVVAALSAKDRQVLETL